MLFNNCGAFASLFVTVFTILYLVLAILEGDDDGDAYERFLQMIPVILAGFLLLIWLMWLVNFIIFLAVVIAITLSSWFLLLLV